MNLSLRDWILMKLDMSNALRPSELFPLRWRCLLEETHIMDIQETVYKGKIRPYGKTKGSLTKVPIADVLADEIFEYREESRKKGQDTSPDGFMFPGRFGGPMDSSNYRHRVLHKLARELGFPKLNFQVIRRTIATLGKTKGHPKDIQGLMRHSRLATTMDIYMQSLEKRCARRSTRFTMSWYPRVLKGQRLNNSWQHPPARETSATQPTTALQRWGDRTRRAERK